VIGAQPDLALDGQTVCLLFEPPAVTLVGSDGAGAEAGTHLRRGANFAARPTHELLGPMNEAVVLGPIGEHFVEWRFP
jgi:hypothetical protein